MLSNNQNKVDQYVVDQSNKTREGEIDIVDIEKRTSILYGSDII